MSVNVLVVSRENPLMIVPISVVSPLSESTFENVAVGYRAQPSTFHRFPGESKQSDSHEETRKPGERKTENGINSMIRSFS